MPAAVHTATPLNLAWRERYEVVGRLGSGGFADVYEAVDLQLGERVALKVIREGRGMAARVLREVEAAASLSHPNIVALYDFFGDGERTYLVWELVEGRQLSELADELRDADVAALGVELLEALAHAHTRGHHPPRRQAAERHARRRGSRQGHGLRHRAHVRHGLADRGRRHHRHGRLHVAGAGRRPTGRSSERRLFGRRGALRALRRPSPPARRHGGRDAVERHRAQAAAARRAATGPARRPHGPDRRRLFGATGATACAPGPRRRACGTARGRRDRREPPAAGTTPGASADADRRRARARRRQRACRGDRRHRPRPSAGVPRRLASAARCADRGGVGRGPRGRSGLAARAARLPDLQRLFQRGDRFPRARRGTLPADARAAHLGRMASARPAARAAVPHAAGAGGGVPCWAAFAAR